MGCLSVSKPWVPTPAKDLCARPTAGAAPSRRACAKLCSSVMSVTTRESTSVVNVALSSAMRRRNVVSISVMPLLTSSVAAGRPCRNRMMTMSTVTPQPARIMIVVMDLICFARAPSCGPGLPPIVRTVPDAERSICISSAIGGAEEPDGGASWWSRRSRAA